MIQNSIDAFHRPPVGARAGHNPRGIDPAEVPSRPSLAVVAANALQGIEDLRPLCGVQLASEGTIDLHDGVVSGNQVGANVQTAGFDVSRLGDNVVFRDNVTSLDSADLPLPTPAGDVPR